MQIEHFESLVCNIMLIVMILVEEFGMMRKWQRVELLMVKYM